MSDDKTNSAQADATVAQPTQNDGVPAGTPESWREELKRIIAQRDELKTKLRTVDEAKAKAEAEEMAKRGEFEKLANERAAEIERLKAEKENVAKEAETKAKLSAVKAAAKEKGVRDIEDVLKLVKLDDVTEENAVETIEALRKAKPYLFAEQVPGVATPPIGGDKGGKTRADLLKDPVALSELARRNPAEYRRLMG